MGFFTTKIKALLALAILFFICASTAFGQVTITQPTGGQNISNDLSNTGPAAAYTPIGDIVIAETAAGDFAAGTNRTLTFDRPSGWQFKPAVGSASGSGSNISYVSVTSVTASRITVRYTINGVTDGTNSITISGIEVQSTTKTLGSEAFVFRQGGSGIINGLIAGGQGIGTPVVPLSKVAGSFTSLQVLLPGQTNAPGTATGKTGNSTPQNAGTPFTVVVNAVDYAYNIVDSAPNDEISLTSNNPGGIIPANINLSAGTAAFNVTLNTAITSSFTANNVTNGGVLSDNSSNISILRGTYAKMLVLLPGETHAPGTPTGKTGAPEDATLTDVYTITVYAVDEYWNKVTSGAVGNTIQITTTDPLVSPINPTTIAIDGIRNLNIRMKTPGNIHTITATDITNTAIEPYTTGTINVVTGVYTKLQILLPGETAAPGTSTGKTGAPIPQMAGVPFNVTVNAVSENWYIIDTVTDVVGLTSTDANAILPTNASLTAGTQQLSITLVTAGDRTITAMNITDETKASNISSSISVGTGSFVKLQVLLPGETAAPGTLTGKTGAPTARPTGIPFNITVNAVDDYWNTVASVTDQVSISSTDANGTHPAAQTLLNGTRNDLSVTLRTFGPHTITASNDDDLAITNGVSSNVNVVSGTFVKLQVLLPGETAAPGTPTGKTGTPIPQVAGVPFNVTVNAVDEVWNIIDAATDEINLTSTDLNAVMPANITLVDGTAQFSVVLVAKGNHKITANNITDGSKTSDVSPNVSLEAGAYARLLVLLPNQNQAPGTPTGIIGNPIIPERGTLFPIRIRAVDQYFNPVDGYTNSLSLVKSHPADAVPASSILHPTSYRNLYVRINAVGVQTITLTDDITSYSTVVTIPEPTSVSNQTDYFRTVASGVWNDAIIWESSTDQTEWIPATLVPNSNSNTITIRNGHVVEVTSNVSVDQVTIQSGGEVIVKSHTFTVADGADPIDMLVEGILTGTNTGVIKSTAGVLVFGSTGKYQHQYTSISGTIPTAIWNEGSICEITGYTSYTGTVAGSNQIFSTFIWNNPNQNTVGNGPALGGGFSAHHLTIVNTGNGMMYLGSGAGTSNITGNFILNGGNVGITKSGARVINIAGNFNLNGGALQRGNAAVTINFNGNTAQLYTSGATVTGAINFVINSGATVDFGTHVLNGTSGTFTLSSGGTIITAHANGLSATGTNVGTIQNTGTRIYNAASFVYNGNVAQAIGNGLPSTINSLTISNEQGVTFASLGQTYTINDVLSIEPTNGFLDMGNNIIAGTFTSTGAGILKTQAVNAFSTGRIWNVGVEYNSATTQNIISGTYNNLLATSNGGVKIGPAGALNVAGNWSSAGGEVDFVTNNTSLSFNGTVSQNLTDLGSNGGQGLEFRNVSFSNSGIKTIVSGNFSVSEVGALTLWSNTTLNANGNLTLLSSATSSARIAPIPASSSIVGNVKVQRYISGGAQDPFRTYRMLSSPVYDNGNSSNRTYSFTQFIDDMIVTGAGGSANGFDPTVGNAASAWTYNNGYVALPNINTSVPVGQGAYIFYRGNRTNITAKITPPFVDPESTIMDFDGVLNQQDVVVPLAYSSAVSGYNLIGNPYASSIDWNSGSIDKSALANNIIMIWDPATRQYATYDGISGANGGSNIIPSGQGFFVQAAHTGSLTFTENAKVGSQAPVLLMGTPIVGDNHTSLEKIAAAPINNAVVLSVPKTEVRAVLSKKDTPYNVETVVVFQEGKSENFVTGEDVPYLKGGEVFLSSISQDDKRLVINYMPQVTEHTKVRFDMTDPAVTSGNYALKINYHELPIGYLIRLNDNYLGTSSYINNGAIYDFVIDKNQPQSYGPDRLSVSFERSATAPKVVNYAGDVTSETNSITIYPNPVVEQFTVRYDGVLKTDKQRLRIVSLTGQVLLSTSVRKEELANGYVVNISGYTAGTYILEIAESNGRSVVKTKLIKQ